MIKDITTALLLTTTYPLKSAWFQTGATFRNPLTSGNQSFHTACQYWQPPKLKYMNSAYNPHVVGVGKGLWRSSEACGQCLEVKNQYKVVRVVVADYCPPPCTPKQLDLNPKASAELNLHHTSPRNHFDLQVREVDCDWGHDLTFYLDKGSSVYNWYMIPLFLKTPLKTVMVLGHVATHDLYGRWVIAFKRMFPKCGVYIEVLVDMKYRVKIKFNCFY